MNDTRRPASATPSQTNLTSLGTLQHAARLARIAATGDLLAGFDCVAVLRQLRRTDPRQPNIFLAHRAQRAYDRRNRDAGSDAWSRLADRLDLAADLDGCEGRR